MQGGVIPRVIGSGTCFADLLYFVAMEDAGEPLESGLLQGRLSPAACQQVTMPLSNLCHAWDLICNDYNHTLACAHS